jgi:hypothetical protein
MKNNYLLLCLIALLLHGTAFSQAVCGFDEVHHQRLQSDAGYRMRVHAGEAAIRQYILQHPRLGQSRPIAVNKAGAPVTTLGGPPYTIPVVVHIVHTGNAIGTIYNPTDAQIQGAIDYLNAVYNGTYPTLSGGVGDLGIQFVLAKRDPSCNPTTGINRIDGSILANYVSGGVRTDSSQPGTDDINLKNLIRWDPTQYYNVWVVDKINGADGTAGQFIAGYAYFPGASASLDGIVMLATQMVTGQKTLPHEIGHAFNLYHPFEGSEDVNTCPPTDHDCSVDGDQVCDTDPISKNISLGIVDFSCRSSSTVNPCATPAGTKYSINTESNYMNYTNCYTLFTAGQKARLLAAAAGAERISLTTSLGGTAPNAGSSPCIPKINFEVDSDQETESTAATSGCRAYKDYTFNMVIGNAPSTTTTATLSVNSGGTAAMGLDFDITTNGSFTSPSMTLTFPSGSIAARPFTVRVYDDASVNGARSFVLSFTVNNGGGNAIAGNGKPNLTITIKDNDSAPASGTATGAASLGTSASGISEAPFDGKAASLRAQFLYKASELTAAGLAAGPITGITLTIAAKHSIRAFTNLNIKIGTAGVSYLINGSVTQGSGMTVVKTLSSYNTVAGTNTFTFDNPYTWNGTSNLVVEFCYDNITAAPGDGGDLVAYYPDGGTSAQGNMFWQDSINCSQAFSTVNAYGNGLKPRMNFLYGIPATIVQTIVNSSVQQYLGPNADVYFYDQANGQLMARIRNLTTFDYGCTQVVIDRQGTGASQFWNNTPANYLMNKTFRVLPTTNNATGSYAITLYYTQGEVVGWQSATGQNLSNIQLVKVGTKISDVTPANPGAAGAVVTGAPAIGTLGTNTSLTYTFTTGFSGFGAGVPAVALPIGLMDFEGKLQGQHVALQWTTTWEQNTRNFGVERSYDGISFGTIAYVPAIGNSNTPHQYVFTDTSIAHEKNYYRLKQTDLDDQFIYSKVIQVNGNTPVNPFTASPSPFSTGVDILFAQAPAGKISIRLLDMTGRSLIRQDNTPAGQRLIHLDLSGITLPAGIYLLEVRTATNTYITKIEKAGH